MIINLINMSHDAPNQMYPNATLFPVALEITYLCKIKQINDNVGALLGTYLEYKKDPVPSERVLKLQLL